MRALEASIRIEWQSWFEVGHVRIDSEHRTFFDIIKAIDHDIRSGADAMKVLRSLNELKLYTEFHFASEENIMEDLRYPDIKAHRVNHKRILAEMNDYITDIRAGIDRAHELIPFLFEWFCGHTVNEDSKLSKYIADVTETDGR